MTEAPGETSPAQTSPGKTSPDKAPPETRRQVGERTRRRVLGDAHVDRSQGGATAFDAPFVDFITEGAWGTVWSGDQFTLRERSLVTLSILAALGREKEFVLHARATLNTGATPEDIREALLHVAVYGGVPAANTAFRLARKALEEAGADLGPATAAEKGAESGEA